MFDLDFRKQLANFKAVSQGLKNAKVKEESRQETTLARGISKVQPTQEQAEQVTAEEKLKIKQRMLKMDMNVVKVYNLQEIFHFWISLTLNSKQGEIQGNGKDNHQGQGQKD